MTDALTGAAYAIQSFIPLFVRCDRTDIHVVPQVKAIHTGKPTIFIYDSYPGGIGLSEKLYGRWKELIDRTAKHVAGCVCEYGCPICIGAQEEGVKTAKRQVSTLLKKLVQ